MILFWPDFDLIKEKEKRLQEITNGIKYPID